MDYYQIFQIDDRTWRLEDCLRAEMYLVAGEKRAALIDTGFGLPGLNTLVKRLTDKPVMVINTHGHGDHCGGNEQFPDCRMRECDWEIARQHQQKSFRRAMIQSLTEEFSLPMDDHEIDELAEIRGSGMFRQLEEQEIIELGGRTLEVIAVPGHTPGSICLLDRQKEYLFSADTVCDQGVLLFFDHSLPVSVYLESIRRLRSRCNEYRTIWPGHHTCPLKKEYLERYEACAEAIIADPKAGIQVESNLGSGRIYGQMGISIAYDTDKVKG